ncbi:NAD(P)-binding domain-containing protein [Jiella pacifica]|uniref:NAD(P)-binding domain-containing protein n=1 Tax=Jiella pacifica TaxID=2696469 RepID=A0A6N9T7F6_9HYPH|nr:NAD(P)-binding domain-containing protein [Jiella pacifica]NDW06006.1 NAD(P)-binding domain-containing protein [Jiella pacifica]
MPKHRLGIIGFGAFGRLTARHLQPHFDIVAHDPALTADDLPSDLRVKLASLAETAACGIVVLAVPVSALAGTIDAIAADSSMPYPSRSSCAGSLGQHDVSDGLRGSIATCR